jgi:hypothetical protein
MSPTTDRFQMPFSDQGIVTALGREQAQCVDPVIRSQTLAGEADRRHEAVCRSCVPKEVIQLRVQTIRHPSRADFLPDVSRHRRVSVNPSVCKRRSRSGSPALLVTADLSPRIGPPNRSAHPAFRTLARSSANPARPYICRLIIFSRLTCPSTGPLLHFPVSAAATAASSWRKPSANLRISGHDD